MLTPSIIFCPVLLIRNHMVSLRCLVLPPLWLGVVLSWPTDDNTSLTSWVALCFRTVSKDSHRGCLRCLKASSFLLQIGTSFTDSQQGIIFQRVWFLGYKCNSAGFCSVFPCTMATWGHLFLVDCSFLNAFSCHIHSHLGKASLWEIQRSGQVLPLLDFRDGAVEAPQFGRSS